MDVTLHYGKYISNISTTVHSITLLCIFLEGNNIDGKGSKIKSCIRKHVCAIRRTFGYIKV